MRKKPRREERGLLALGAAKLPVVVIADAGRAARKEEIRRVWNHM